MTQLEPSNIGLKKHITTAITEGNSYEEMGLLSLKNDMVRLYYLMS
jgi:hypothetical protein